MRCLHVAMLSSILVAATAVVTAGVTAQDQDETVPGWLRLCERGDQHDLLDRLEGRWEQTVRFWSGPDAAPEESKSRSHFQWMYGGRFLRGEMDGYVFGDRIRAVGIMGYDSLREEYFSFLIDNRSTSYLLARGTWDAAAEALVLRGTMDDPSTGERDIPFRLVRRFEDEEAVLEMFLPLPDGSTYRALEVRSVPAE